MEATFSESFAFIAHDLVVPQQFPARCQAGNLTKEEVKFIDYVIKHPKVELHVHAEAAVSSHFYLQLNNKKKQYSHETMQGNKPPFLNFADFVKAWVRNTKLVDNAEILEELIVEFARGRQEQGIFYSEVHVSPGDFSYLRKRFLPDLDPLDYEAVLFSYAKGAKRAAQLYPKVFIRFIVDLVWLADAGDMALVHRALSHVLQDPDSQDSRVQHCCPAESCFFVGVGLGGPENSAKADFFGEHFNFLQSLGLKIDIHTGETTNAKDMLHSVTAIAPHRVSHGIACADQGIWLSQHSSFCFVSNVVTGAWKKDPATHPIARAWHRAESLYSSNQNLEGITGSFSLSSDDPLLMGTCLAFEYLMCFRIFGFSVTFFHLTQRMALSAAFHPAVAKQALTS